MLRFKPELTNFVNNSVKIFTASTNRNLLLSSNSSNHGVASKRMNENFQCMNRQTRSEQPDLLRSGFGKSCNTENNRPAFYANAKMERKTLSQVDLSVKRLIILLKFR